MECYTSTEIASKETILSQTIEAKEKLNLFLFSTGKIVSYLATYIYSYAISLYILKVTGSGSSFALSILLGTLPRVIFSPIAGSLSDRVSKRKMIVGLDFLSGIVLLFLFSISLMFGFKLSFVYAVNFILAVISTFFNTCFSTAIPNLVTDKKLVTINSYNRAIDSGCQILGPILAGVFFGFISIKLLILVNGISFILSAISELFIDFNLNSAKKDKSLSSNISLKTIVTDFKEVYQCIKSIKFLLLIIPVSMSFNLLLSANLSVVLPFLINNTIGMSSTQYGIIEGTLSVGMLASAILIGKLPEKEKKRKSLSISFIGMGLSMICMGIPALSIFRSLNIYISFGIYVITALLFSFFLVMGDLPLTIVMQRAVPKHMLGRVMGVQYMLSSSLTLIGIIGAGVIIDFIPPYVLYFVTGAYLLIIAFMVYKHKAMKDV